NLLIYNIKSSSTSKYVTCTSSLCELQTQCTKSSSQCPYKVKSYSNATSSGILVEDVLHLKTDNHQPKDINARITLGSPWYNITITHLSVEGNISDLLDSTAIFYSGAEYTYLNYPAYTALCDS
ncbi:hypothetical protein MKW94_029292, partial [Papaver nudicaule]|nr:hypothetical protein [Papaver nudicaule]